jgi:hypothetical protein
MAAVQMGVQEKVLTDVVRDLRIEERRNILARIC